MSIFNFFLHLNAYSDKKSNNSPSLNHFRWTRDIGGITVENPQSSAMTIAENSSTVVFDGKSNKILYLESNKEISVTINDTDTFVIKPIIVGTSSYPGSLYLTSLINKLEITNASLDEQASIFMACAE